MYMGLYNSIDRLSCYKNLQRLWNSKREIRGANSFESIDIMPIQKRVLFDAEIS